MPRARHAARAWPLLAVLLAVCAGAPGTPPGMVLTSSADGRDTIERTHAVVRTGVAAEPRAAAGERLVALPASAPAPIAAPAPAFVPGAARVATPAIGRPLTAAAARAPPAPPRV